jgi:palmitoyl-protein thioesterase
MVKFLQDKIVTPIETSWFGFYETGSDKRVLSLVESSFYTSDKLGLKQMMEGGKLVFMEVENEGI